MTVQVLADSHSLTENHQDQPERQVTGGYCGDLLSWVMGRAQADEAWLTIMSNGNVAAVAALTDCACVILTDSVQPDPDLLTKAKALGINLLGAGAETYETALALAEALRAKA